MQTSAIFPKEDSGEPVTAIILPNGLAFFACSTTSLLSPEYEIAKLHHFFLHLKLEPHLHEDR